MTGNGPISPALYFSPAFGSTYVTQSATYSGRPVAQAPTSPASSSVVRPRAGTTQPPGGSSQAGLSLLSPTSPTGAIGSTGPASVTVNTSPSYVPTTWNSPQVPSPAVSSPVTASQLQFVI